MSSERGSVSVLLQTATPRMISSSLRIQTPVQPVAAKTTAWQQPASATRGATSNVSLSKRFEELANLEVGWASEPDDEYYDTGSVPTRAFLEQVEAQLDRMVPLIVHGYPLAVFATIQGGVEIMWRLENTTKILRVQPDTYSVSGSSINVLVGTVDRGFWFEGLKPNSPYPPQIVKWING